MNSAVSGLEKVKRHLDTTLANKNTPDYYSRLSKHGNLGFELLCDWPWFAINIKGIKKLSHTPSSSIVLCKYSLQHIVKREPTNYF